MGNGKVYRAIGLMSGTSMDGVDVAMIDTDGQGFVHPVAFESYAYMKEEQDILRAALRKSKDDAAVAKAEEMVTQAHIAAVKAFLRQHDDRKRTVELIGFHGHTILHDPNRQLSWQIGDAQRLANETGINVVADMRQADLKAGGQGAPLLPLYHRALAAQLEKPVAIVNIGGVANVTWIGPGADDVIAFDCGPGNALLDDFVQDRTDALYDEDGALAREGQVLKSVVAKWMEHEFFHRPPPKSLDRGGWVIVGLSALSDENGAASLTAFTVCGIATSLAFMPQAPRAIYVTGGGRKNAFLMESLAKALPCPVGAVEDLGWNGDALEAQGFAYLAVRSVEGLPLTLPGTTGVSAPLTGGAVYRVRR